jgi:hypothetical protein
VFSRYSPVLRTGVHHPKIFPLQDFSWFSFPLGSSDVKLLFLPPRFA